jgi:multiple sugar transport system substrate-binding protein/putative aldouronate transport system substrate-binding protein
MLLPIVASCGGGRGEVIDLVIYSQLANYSGEMIGWGAEILLDKFNVRVTIINDAADGTFQSRMESGFLGDIVLFGNDAREYRNASAAGLLFDWEEDDLLADFGQDIAEYFPFALEKNKSITGTLHGFGHEIAGSSDDHAAFYYYPQLRFDLYQQLGYPVINTLEDFIPVIADMVALEPISSVGTKTWGVSSFPDWDGDMVMMVKSTSALYGWEEFQVGLYCTQTREWQGALEEGGWYLRALKFYNTLHQMGLYDPDSMTQSWDNVVEKYKNGEAMFNIFAWIADNFNTDKHEEEGKIMMPVVAQDQMNLADGLSVFGKNRVWTIGANSNYPELAMEIINWFSTPEGVLSYMYGPLGVTWDYDDDGEPYMTELGLATQSDSDTIIQYRNYEGSYKNGEFQHNNVTWARDAINPDSPSGNSFNYETWDSTLLAIVPSAIEQEWRDWTGYNRPDDWFTSMGKKSVAIASAYTQTATDMVFEMTIEAVREVIKEGSWNAIYANSDEEFDNIVRQMITNAIAFGYDEWVEFSLGEAQLRREAEDAITGGR